MTLENPSPQTLYMREWSRRNRQRLNADNARRYRENQQTRDRIRGRARMANLRKRGGVDLPTEEYVSVLLQDPCVYCGEPADNPGQITPTTSSIDHIDATGDSHWENLTAACTRCNGAKGRMSMTLFLLERRVRRELLPLAEELWLVRGSGSDRRRIEL